MIRGRSPQHKYEECSAYGSFFLSRLFKIRQTPLLKISSDDPNLKLDDFLLRMALRIFVSQSLVLTPLTALLEHPVQK